jgi:hypothetical protein
MTTSSQTKTERLSVLRDVLSVLRTIGEVFLERVLPP